MELKSLIARAQKGDIAAFTKLVERYRNLAFGYAFSLLRDFQLAEDATQEAFLAAYFSLADLETPAAFPGWLRGIVRHQASRILRKRRRESRFVDFGFLESAADVAVENPAPDAQFESKEAMGLVLNIINALPEAQREVTTLYYIQEYSHEEIAAFLDLPVTTVNNRLAAARTKLKRRMTSMVKKTIKKHALPKEFAGKVGRVIAIHGTIVDARFDVKDLPAVLTTLSVRQESLGDGRTLDIKIEVAQHLGDGIVRCIARDCSESLQPGMKVINTDEVSSFPVDDKETYRKTVEELSRLGKKPDLDKRKSKGAEILETGIKVIDLFCPLLKGGTAVICGDLRVGKLVLIEELARRVASSGGVASLWAFIQPAEAPVVQKAAKQDPNYSGGMKGDVRTLFLRSEIADSGERHGVEDFSVEAVAFVSKDVAQWGIYPAVDPLLSPSRSLRPTIVGEEHCSVAGQARELLQQSRKLLNTNDESNRLTADERRIVSRGHKLQLFLSQPFFVAEPYTKVPGKHIPRVETVQACRAIIEGEYDDLPEEAFYFVGGMDEVEMKARPR